MIHSSIAAVRSVSSALRNRISRAGPSGQASAFRRASFAIASSLSRSVPVGLLRLRGKIKNLSLDQFELYSVGNLGPTPDVATILLWLGVEPRDPAVALFQVVAVDYRLGCSNSRTVLFAAKVGCLDEMAILAEDIKPIVLHL